MGDEMEVIERHKRVPTFTRLPTKYEREKHDRMPMVFAWMIVGGGMLVAAVLL